MPAQLTPDDAGEYIFKNKDGFYDLGDLDTTLFEGCVDPGSGEKSKLARSDSFTCGGITSVPDPAELLKKMTGEGAIEVDGEEKTYPSTDSLKAAGLYIRAYGDVVHKDRRCAGTKFVLDLGGSLGLYRDTTGNGDLFYFPLAKQGDSALYKQEGGSTEHTWDKLGEHLSTVDDLGGVHVRLAQVLSSEFKGKLGKSEVIAIGAMLADAKYSPDLATKLWTMSRTM